MKRIVKKNQIILTLLAVMIAVAGYLSYAGKFNLPDGEKQAQADAQNGETVAAGLLDISDEDILRENQGISLAENDEITDVYVPAEEEENGQAGADMPGEAVLTSGMTVDSYVSQAQLNREQVRSKNQETLLGIINNEELGDEQKQEAVNQMIELTDIAEKENAAETLLGAKGFTDSVVCINGATVDVVVGKSELTDAERAQIEDIVKRKADTPAENVVITLMDLKQ